jgi:hypothetical protein
MKVSKPAVMRFRPTTRNDPNFGDLVELLRVRSCVSLPPVFDQPPAEAFAVRGCKLGALRKLPSHEKPSHETGRAVSAWCCIPGLGHTRISQALLVVGLICCTATPNCLVSKTIFCNFILCDQKDSCSLALPLGVQPKAGVGTWIDAMLPSQRTFTQYCSHQNGVALRSTYPIAFFSRCGRITEICNGPNRERRMGVITLIRVH